MRSGGSGLQGILPSWPEMLPELYWDVQLVGEIKLLSWDVADVVGGWSSG